MAALVAGVQYGLSSHSNFHENKSLIFVKLTDSAQRAIEEYLRNKNKINQNPTIQFLGNEGQLSFPSTRSNYGNFTFSLSNNQDIEGPQGGFECVQQTGPKNLESLGTLPCKMRIQANDDVYETTKHRMHVAEENNKNKCTRVIKASEPIGRKVKVKGPSRIISSSSKISSTKSRDFSNTSTSTNQSSSLMNSQKLNTNSLSSNRSQSDTQKKSTDIIRRPLKERLIHLLALRPFKRPELYDRINKEGIKEKEKNVVATILKQIAFMRDNTYHLQRSVWNDVQEDWPFYSEQEKGMLKRRKPQNLTPPGSSDGGSSGSGQSPNSTHSGSPSAITAPPLDIFGSKRPGYYQGNDGLPTKRQRISHYRKPESGASSVGDIGKSVINSVCNFDSKLQPLQRNSQQHHSQQQQKNNCIAIKSNSIPNCNNEETAVGALLASNKPIIIKDSPINKNHRIDRQNNSNHNYLHYEYQQQQQHTFSHEKEANIHKNSIDVISTKFNNSNINNEEDEINHPQIFAEIEPADTKVDKKVNRDASESNDCLSRSHDDKSYDYLKINTVGDPLLSFTTASCDSISPTSSDNFRYSDYPDYLTCYTEISNSEQRTRYKAEFNAYYKEYRKLHVQVVKISKQFSYLEEELRKKLESGNIEGYELIKHQILQEYARTKNVNARFYYLHDKLGHIKKLVSEYDAKMNTDHIICSNNQINNYSDLDNNALNHDESESRCALTRFTENQQVTYISKITHIS